VPFPIPVYGLTGGIASGKSTVSQMLRELGAEVIDADVLARQVVEPGQPATTEIAERFPGVVGPDGTLDRKALGQRVFADPAERAALEAITHPRIHQLLHREVERLAAAGAPLAIYDAALLIERGTHTQLDGLILVSVPKIHQLARLIRRDGLKMEEALQRLSSQLPLEDKAKVATWIIENGGTREATHDQVTALWTKLTAPRE
jgi:dephospho-CoA kinase